jgi:hypothetical protein
MRPLGRAQSTFVENIFKGRDMIIYAVPQGKPIDYITSLYRLFSNQF